MKKRIVGILLSLCIFMGMAPGCGTKGETASGAGSNTDIVQKSVCEAGSIADAVQESASGAADAASGDPAEEC